MTSFNFSFSASSRRPRNFLPIPIEVPVGKASDFSHYFYSYENKTKRYLVEDCEQLLLKKYLKICIQQMLFSNILNTLKNTNLKIKFKKINWRWLLQSYSLDFKNEARRQKDRVDTSFERKMKHILLFLGSFLEKTWKVDSAFSFFDHNFIKSFT